MAMFPLNHLAPELSHVVSVTKVVKYIMKWPFWVSYIFVFRQTDRSSRGQRSSRSCVNFAPDFIRLILTGWRQSGNFGSLYFDQGKWNDTQFDLKTLRSEPHVTGKVRSTWLMVHICKILNEAKQLPVGAIVIRLLLVLLLKAYKQ